MHEKPHICLIFSRARAVGDGIVAPAGGGNFGDLREGRYGKRFSFDSAVWQWGGKVGNLLVDGTGWEYAIYWWDEIGARVGKSVGNIVGKTAGGRECLAWICLSRRYRPAGAIHPHNCHACRVLCVRVRCVYFWFL